MEPSTEEKKIFLHVEPDQSHYANVVEGLERVDPGQYNVETVLFPTEAIDRIRKDTNHQIVLIAISQSTGLTDIANLLEILKTREDIVRVFLYTIEDPRRAEVRTALGNPRIDIPLDILAASQYITDVVKEFLDTKNSSDTPT